MSNNNVIFSCVIPTYGRVGLVEELLKSLRAARLVEDSMPEIIIIDNSIPNEAKQIQNICLRYNAVYVEGTSSVRVKRNKGVSMAHGDYIFFIDSDCKADANALIEHYRVLSQPEYDACIGLTSFVGKDGFLWEVINGSQFMYPFRFASIFKGKMDSAPWGPTCNFTVKKAALDQIGGFNTNFPFKLGADDVDMGLRLCDNGFKIGMNENAIVYHSRETWSSLRLITKRVFRWGRMNYFMYKLHPDRIGLTFPKSLSFWLMICAVQALLTLKCSPWLLLGILIWPVLQLWFYAVFRKRQNITKDCKVAVTMGSETLNTLFDFGCFLMSAVHGSFKCLYSEPKNNPKDIWLQKVHSIWGSFLATLIIVIIDLFCIVML